MEHKVFADRIIDAIQESHALHITTLLEIKETLIRLDARVDKIEVTLTLRVQQLEKEVASLRERCKEGDMEVLSTRQHVTQNLEHELKRRDEERRKWMFYAITVVVSFLTGSVGLSLLAKLIH